MNLRDSIKQIAKELITDNALICTVKDVNDTNRTCTCEPVNGDADILEVRLQAVSGGGIYLKPSVGSVVVVTMIGETLGSVVLTSELDEVIFFDGSLGGLVKVQELKDNLDKTNEVVQAIVDSLKNWVVVPSDGGAALKTFFNTQLGIKTVGDFSDIENDKVKHGV